MEARAWPQAKREEAGPKGSANKRCGRRASAFEGVWTPDGPGRKVPQEFGGAGRNRTGDRGFADPGLTTWLPRLITGSTVN